MSLLTCFRVPFHDAESSPPPASAGHGMEAQGLRALLPELTRWLLALGAGWSLPGLPHSPPTVLRKPLEYGQN